MTTLGRSRNSRARHAFVNTACTCIIIFLRTNRSSPSAPLRYPSTPIAVGDSCSPTNPPLPGAGQSGPSSPLRFATTSPAFVVAHNATCLSLTGVVQTRGSVQFMDEALPLPVFSSSNLGRVRGSGTQHFPKHAGQYSTVGAASPSEVRNRFRSQSLYIY